MSDAELSALRTEIERLLAAAIKSDSDHETEIEWMEQHHAAEMERIEGLNAADQANLRHALDTRDIIGQAKGIVMAAMHCSADEAFAMLSRQSQHENRKVAVIAAEIVERVSPSRRSPDA